jgi:hypothetical protein
MPEADGSKQRQSTSGVSFRLDPRLIENKASAKRMLFVVVAGVSAAILAGIFALVMAIHKQRDQPQKQQSDGSLESKPAASSIEIELE